MEPTSPVNGPATNPTAQTTSPEEAALQREAFESIRAEIDAVQKDDFATINVEIPAAVMVVIGHLAHVAPYRDQIEAAVPAFHMPSFDKLGVYARAAGHAHTHYLVASVPLEPVGPLVEELGTIKETLGPDVSALARRGYLDGERLKNLQGTTGYKNIANDVLLYAALLRENWSTVQSKTAIPFEEVERAERVANRLVEALARRDAGLAAISAANLTRQAAFTLFFNAWNQVRRAVSFLRWDEDDAEKFAPSLFVGRGGRKKSEPEGTDEPANGSPAPTPPVVASPTAPVVTTNGSNGSSHGATDIAPGLPGHSPFGLP